MDCDELQVQKELHVETLDSSKKARGLGTLVYFHDLLGDSLARIKLLKQRWCRADATACTNFTSVPLCTGEQAVT